MRILSIQKPISWLLAALLVLPSVGGHGFCHAHVAGDKSHTHTEEAHKDNNCISHHHHGNHSHEKCVENEAQTAEVAIQHNHLSFFGIDFSLPDSDDSQNTDNGSQSSTFLSLTHDLPMVLIARTLDHEGLKTLSLSPTECDILAFQTQVLTTPQISSTPLCDCARFERSGVLVI